jgi:hypothetical protein
MGGGVMRKLKIGRWLGLLLVVGFVLTSTSCPRVGETIGVLLVYHGGQDTSKSQYMWDATIQQFVYDPNHTIYKYIIWNPSIWPEILHVEVAAKYLRKFDFAYERIGGTDPNRSRAEGQLADMKAELDKKAWMYDLQFEAEVVGYIWGDKLEYLPNPRYILHDPAGTGVDVTYCGEEDPGGPWPGCDPNRYDVDGSVDRLLKKGVSKILLVSPVVGGTRFYKPHYVYRMTKRRVDEWNAENGTSVSVLWINDYSDLMERTYPSAPEGWTPTLGLDIEGFTEEHVLLNGSPNPVAEDPDLAAIHVDGIEASMSDTVSDAETGVIIWGHAIKNDGEVYDPKVDDTITINENIKSELLRRHPDMDPENILGSWEGSAQLNPENGIVEVNREMRGEDRGYGYLYQSDKQMPDHPWGYRNWDALEYLKNRGVKHIVIAHSHILTDSVLNVVELPNEVGREIGRKDSECDGGPCCFEMGGCADGRPYPPPRQVPLNEEREELDPSLGFDVSEYGHLGYDPDVGPPDPNAPVQDQYTGTWNMWVCPSYDPAVGKLMAKHVLNAAVNPMVYITNGEVESVEAGESVTFEAHVVTGAPEYTYTWLVRKRGALQSWWMPVGGDSSTWTWTPGADDAGTYDVRCKVKDARGGTGKVEWKEFEVTT